MKKINNYLQDTYNNLIDKIRMISLQKDNISEDKYVKPLRAGLAGVLLYFFLTLIMFLVAKGTALPYIGAQLLTLTPSVMLGGIAIKSSKKHFSFKETFKNLFSKKTKASRIHKELDLSLEEEKHNTRLFIIGDAMDTNDTKTIDTIDLSKQIAADNRELSEVYTKLYKAERPGNIVRFFKKEDKKYLNGLEVFAASICMGTALALTTNVLALSSAFTNISALHGIIPFVIGASIMPAYTISSKQAIKKVKKDVNYDSLDIDETPVDELVEMSKKATELECKLQKEYEAKKVQTTTVEETYHPHSYFEEVLYENEASLNDTDEETMQKKKTIK